MLGLGTILNALGILIGGVVGLTSKRHVSPANQTLLKLGMGAFIVYAGLSMTWQSVNGSFLQISKQLLIVVLSMTVGKLVGRLLHIQKLLNRLGHFAKEKYAGTQPGQRANAGDGFVVCAVLFCVTPIAVLGATADGLTGNFKVLAVKALMDALATLAFVGTFGWSAILSVIPVVAFQGTITLAAALLRPWLESHQLLDPVNATAGLLVFCIALIIFELKKVELADYLPSLAFAPLLTWLWP